MLLKLMVNSLPVIYLVRNILIIRKIKFSSYIVQISYRSARRFGSKMSAIGTARNVSIKILFASTLLAMAFVGTHRGCKKLVNVRLSIRMKASLLAYLTNVLAVQYGTEDQKKSIPSNIAFYFVKSMALPTTFSFATAILTSPGVGITLIASLPYN